MRVCDGPAGADIPPEELEALRAKLLEVYRRLVRVFGTPERTGHLDPVSELVSTILSQNTSDTNRDRAFARLRARFPTWEEVRDADVRQIREAIRPAGLSEVKAPRIKQALQIVSEQAQGRLSLDFMNDMSVAEAKAWLTAIKGVGPKTAAIILLFSFGRPAFPVDTHIHRVGKRLALIGARVSREKAHGIFEALIPPELYYPAHIDIIRHGREICHAQQPRCEVCPLRDLCCYYATCVERTVSGPPSLCGGTSDA
ncbi:MAG TPA: endonuclease III [Anaerolineae bacterium]|nr:endonuclease III [Anaerolineae bacterium]HOQ97194.1 endonuclease III [Anaerolineae bacterium]HPL26420.1 endonuclease III [Anaerolineae bacterium]